MNWFIENWSTWLGVIGTVLGLWISYKLRGHPLLTYKVIKPTIAVPGSGVRVKLHPLKTTDGAEQMVFTTRFTNAGTDSIEQPSANEGFVFLTCPPGWEFVGANYKDGNGINPRPTFKTENVDEHHFMVIDFKALEPGQWMECVYTLKRTTAEGNIVIVPIASGKLKGSLTGVRNVLSGKTIAYQFVRAILDHLPALIGVLLLPILMAHEIVTQYFSSHNLWITVLYTSIVTIVLGLLIHGVVSLVLLVTTPQSKAKLDKTFTARTQSRILRLRILITIILFVIFSIAQGAIIGVQYMLALAVLSLVVMITNVLFNLVAYNPERHATENGVIAYLAGTTAAGFAIGFLAISTIVGIMGIEVAIGIYLIWTTCAQTMLLRHIRKQGERDSNASSLFTGF